MTSTFEPSTDYDKRATVGPENGWLIIHGGGRLTNEAKTRFVALAGGSQASFVVIPTARRDKDIDVDKYRLSMAKLFGVEHVTVLHTRDRARANSEGFVAPLRHASGVWIDGGRQWRLTNAYLETAVESELKALLIRGGVVFGSSAGATIQGSYLVRADPGTPDRPDGDSSIVVSPGHEIGFGLLANSVIDQHVNTRGRERDLTPVISEHPELLGIGIDQEAAIVVRRNSFFVMGGRVTIHDGQNHNGRHYYFLSANQAFNLKTRSVDAAIGPQAENEYPMTLIVTTAARSREKSSIRTRGSGLLESRDGTTKKSERVNFECNVSLFSVGGNIYPARSNAPNQLMIPVREIDSNELREYLCTYC